MSKGIWRLIAVLVTLLSVGANSLPAVRGSQPRPIEFTINVGLDSYGSRGTCISYRVPNGSLVTGYFRVTNVNRAAVRAAVSINDGANQPFSYQDVNGEARFSFRSKSEPSSTLYEACIRAIPRHGGAASPPGSSVDVALHLGWNFDLFDDLAAKRIMLDPIQADFLQLEASIERLTGELTDFVRFEELHRDENDSTIVYLRFMSLLATGILIGLGITQVIYMKKFFVTKKLI